jgi:sugar-specific transcriptional regulator TrmB
MDISIFKKLGFSDKTARIYLTLITLGPTSVRNLAKKTEFNRGTVYDGLKWLKDMGVVNYYEKESKQFFVAEDPDKLYDLVNRQTEQLQEVSKRMKDTVLELKSVYDKGGERPLARYYEKGEIRKILEQVLSRCEESGELVYRVYSDADIRDYLYDGFESFSDARIAKGIKVKAIAIGGGGELRGLDERKWLNIKKDSPTYIIIYPGSTAYISLNSQGDLVGVVIENDGVYQTQKGIFDALWETLK